MASIFESLMAQSSSLLTKIVKRTSTNSISSKMSTLIWQSITWLIQCFRPLRSQQKMRMKSQKVLSSSMMMKSAICWGILYQANTWAFMVRRWHLWILIPMRTSIPLKLLSRMVWMRMKIRRLQGIRLLSLRLLSMIILKWEEFWQRRWNPSIKLERMASIRTVNVCMALSKLITILISWSSQLGMILISTMRWNLRKSRTQFLGSCMWVMRKWLLYFMWSPMLMSSKSWLIICILLWMIRMQRWRNSIRSSRNFWIFQNHLFRDCLTWMRMKFMRKDKRKLCSLINLDRLWYVISEFMI